MCRKVLEEEDGKNFSKAYYKKANIEIGLSKYDEAKLTIKQGIKSLSIDTTSSITKEDYLKILSDVKQLSNNEKSIYQNMFKKEDSDDEEKPLSQKVGRKE